MNGARGVIINVTGGPDMSLMEVNEALTVIQEAAHEDANIIFGAVVDPQLTGKVKITVIATGFDHVSGMRSAPAVAPKQTPVDLQSYTSHLASSRQRAAACGRRSIRDAGPVDDRAAPGNRAARARRTRMARGGAGDGCSGGADRTRELESRARRAGVSAPQRGLSGGGRRPSQAERRRRPVIE